MTTFTISGPKAHKLTVEDISHNDDYMIYASGNSIWMRSERGICRTLMHGYQSPAEMLEILSEWAADCKSSFEADFLAEMKTALKN